MISLKVLDIKGFMESLLIQSVFDNFYVSELALSTFYHIKLDGKIQKDWFTREEQEIINGREYCLWSEIKPVIYQLIKGKKTPLSFKIVFLLSPENTEKIISKSGISFTSQNVNGLFLNVKYEKGNLTLVTGTSVNTFSLDKTLDREWDEDLKVFLKHFKIAAEEEK